LAGLLNSAQYGYLSRRASLASAQANEKADSLTPSESALRSSKQRHTDEEVIEK